MAEEEGESKMKNKEKGQKKANKQNADMVVYIDYELRCQFCHRIVERTDCRDGTIEYPLAKNGNLYGIINKGTKDETVICPNCTVKLKPLIRTIIQNTRKDERERILEALKKLFKARKQQSEKIGGKYNLGRVVGIGECMRIIKKEMSKNE